MFPFKKAQTIVKLAIFLASVSKGVGEENVSMVLTKIEDWIFDGHFIHPLKASCIPRSECIGEENRREELDNLFDSNCECGEQCIDHDTCCIDSPHLGKMKRNRYDKMCSRVVHSDLSVFMVTSCETEWNGDPLTRSSCESDSNSLKEPTRFLPVTSNITKVSYKNNFCAVCNNDHEEVVFWQISFAFDDSKNYFDPEEYDNKWSIQDLVYSNETKSWGIIVQDEYAEDKKFRPVTIKIDIPEKLTAVVKLCYPNLISSCDPTWRDVTAIRYCEEYMDAFATSPDNDLERKVFRNSLCAVCNYANDFDSYNCTEVLEETVRGFSLNDGVKKHFGRSFYSLLNFNTKKGGSQYVEPPKCEIGEVYDVHFKRCRRLSCSQPGFIIRNGICVKP